MLSQQPAGAHSLAGVHHRQQLAAALASGGRHQQHLRAAIGQIVRASSRRDASACQCCAGPHDKGLGPEAGLDLGYSCAMECNLAASIGCGVHTALWFVLTERKQVAVSGDGTMILCAS